MKTVRAVVLFVCLFMSSTVLIGDAFVAGALVCTAKGAGPLGAFLATNPLVAPVTIGVGGAGLAGYLVWNWIREIKGSKKAAQKNKNQNTTTAIPPPQDPKKPRNDDDFHNMYEVFERAPIGQKLKAASEPTRFSYKYTSKIFRMIKDLPEYGMKKGDWFYLDKMHGDHIEVFKSCGKAVRTVLNMDGTQNFKKFSYAIERGREILKWIS